MTRAAIGVHLVTAVVGAVGITQGREGPGELLGGISNHLACGKAICPLWTAVRRSLSAQFGLRLRQEVLQ